MVANTKSRTWSRGQEKSLSRSDSRVKIKPDLVVFGILILLMVLIIAVVLLLAKFGGVYFPASDWVLPP